MLGAPGRESVVPPQAPAGRAARRAQYDHVLRMKDARHGRPSYSAVMRPDLPFALGGAALGALLLGTITSSLIVLRVEAFWQQAAIGALLLLAIAFDRLVGLRVDARLRRRSARRAG